VAVEEKQPAPDFELPDESGSTVRLSDWGGSRVILYFYPRADTPGCTVEACEFRDQYPQIEEAGAVVLGVSPDSVSAVRKFRDKFQLPFRLLADEDHSVAELYGVWKEKSRYGKKYWGVERTTFLIDRDGKVERVYQKVRPEGHAAEVLESIEAPG
jgi:thioredoxin-dependent peroxiredoxin